MKKTYPTAELVRELLRYKPKTGRLKWKRRELHHFPNLRACASWNARNANQPAFTDPLGRGSIFNVIYPKANIIWIYQTGGLPSGPIIHRNDDIQDYRWANLINVTSSQAAVVHARHRVPNRIGIRGAFITSAGKIGVRCGKRWLGVFDTRQQARIARLDAERDMDRGNAGSEHATTCSR